jgi:hypothetical protein
MLMCIGIGNRCGERAAVNAAVSEDGARTGVDADATTDAAVLPLS